MTNQEPLAVQFSESLQRVSNARLTDYKKSVELPTERPETRAILELNHQIRTIPEHRNEFRSNLFAWPAPLEAYEFP